MEPAPTRVVAASLLATAAAEEFEIAAVRALPDGSAAVLEAGRHGDARARGRARLHLVARDGKRTIVDLLGPPQAQCDFPLAVRVRPNRVLVTAFHAQRSMLVYWLYALDGTRLRHGSIAGASEPLAWSEGGERVWIHAATEHLLVAEPSTQTPQGIVRRLPRARGLTPESRLFVVQDRLAALPPLVERQRAGKTEAVTPGRMTWVDLDGVGPDEESAWPEQTFRVVIAGNALWAAGPQGLWRLAPGEPLRRFPTGACWAVTAEGPAAWVGTRPTPDCCLIAELDGTTGKDRWKTRVPDVPYDLHRVGRSLVVTGFRWWAWLGEHGALRARSELRREVGFARLANGAAAVSSGRDVAVFAADGDLRRRVELPYDGEILGATAHHFLFGPPPNGSLRPEPDALLAIDEAGAIAGKVPLSGDGAVRIPVRPPQGWGATEDPRAIGADFVLLVGTNGNSCRRWALPRT